MSIDVQLRNALAIVPAGRWIVGVSGGADSVTLLTSLVRCRPDVEPVVAHLNHESRGDASDGDAAFVAALAHSLGAPCVVARVTDFVPIPLRAHEATYRAARLTFFRQLVSTHAAVGVLLAHHADDRAETTLLRLLRGGEPSALGGLRAESEVDGLRIHRPLLPLRRARLENFLRETGQSWRVDASNASDVFARNRVRAFLASRDELVEPLLALADAADRLREWTRANTPTLADVFDAEGLADLPAPLARAAARAWLLKRCVTDLDSGAADRLIAMASDRASPGRMEFAGGVRVRRRAGRIACEP